MIAIPNDAPATRVSKATAAVSRPGQLGFTLVELLLALTITVIVMVVVLVSLDAHSLVARQQMDIGDLQQSTRVSHRSMIHLVRMAGRGGLPRPLAVLVEQNADDDLMIGGEPVEPGTDILTVRGSFDSPIFRADSDDPEVFVVAGATAQLRIDSVTNSGFVQPLDSLEALVMPDGTVPPEAVLLTSRQGDSIYAVVELQGIVFEDLDLDIQNQNVPVRRATLTFNIDPGDGVHTAQYLALSAGGVFPPNLTAVLLMTVLQEHRFYIRRGYAIPGDDQSQARPKLCQARMFPATAAVYAGDVANAALEIAENILDLQVAFGIDLDGDGSIDELDDDGEPLPGDQDEWQWNDPADEDTLAWTLASMHFVRLTTLGHTRSPDRQYLSESIDFVEDHEYAETVPTDPDEIAARRFRRRMLQNVIDMRNL